MPKKGSPREEVYDIDHGHCIKFLKAEERDHQQKSEAAEQPTAPLNGHCQRLVAENTHSSEQLTFERRKAAEESRQLKSEVLILQQSLEAATSKDQVPREKHQKELDGLLRYTSLSNMEYGRPYCQLARFPVETPQSIVSFIALGLGRHVFPFLLAIRYGQTGIVLRLFTYLSALYYFRGLCSPVI